MIKKLLLFIFLTVSSLGFTQNIDRVLVNGKINVPADEDAEGISVYNISSQKGTVTDENGHFQIAVAENDRLQIFALQYQTFIVIIDQAIVERKKLNIIVNPEITQLDVVVIRPYDLTGNIKVDVAKIPTYYVGRNWDLSYKTLEFGYDFKPDQYSSIRGSVADDALNLHQLYNGLNFISIAGGLANLLFPQKITLQQKVRDDQKKSNNIQQRFTREFIHDNFGIKRERTMDFLYFAREQGLSDELLKPENEIRLMDFLHEKSKEYKARAKQ